MDGDNSVEMEGETIGGVSSIEAPTSGGEIGHGSNRGKDKAPPEDEI